MKMELEKAEIAEVPPSSIAEREEENREREIADRDRLISKGKGVLDLCIRQNKLLCVEGFVDSQIERGGVYLDVVREMQEYIAAELDKEQGKQERNNLNELHDYIADKLHEVFMNR